jgi:hypothetical protein
MRLLPRAALRSGSEHQQWTDHKPLVTALSLSPHQQHHLAFISEFNVQMLYLPGLKNIFADFLSRPSPHPQNLLKQSPPRQRQIQSISKLWQPSKIAAQKCSACLAAHPSNLLFAAGTQCLAGNVTTGVFRQLSQKNSEKTFSSICTTFHILLGSPRGVWYLLGLSGEGSPMTSLPSREPASTSRGQDPSSHMPAATASPHRSLHFSHLHIDLVGPLQYSGGFNFIFTRHNSSTQLPSCQTSCCAPPSSGCAA